MNESKIWNIVKNSLVGMLSQISSLLLAFIVRSFFIRYIGVDLLGINSTFASILNALSFAELGFYAVISFNLYKPLADGNQEKINDILNILKMVYRRVGIFFVTASFILLPFLRFLLTDIEFDSIFYVYFLIQAAASAFSYFTAYRRTLLYADQKEYISKIIDMIINVVISVVQCIVLITLGNYIVYIVLIVIRTVSSNYIVNEYCEKHYDYLKSTALNKTLYKSILKDVKNVFTAKIAGYVYNSTDNIIISAFISTISVGYFVNYTMIYSGLKTLSSCILSPVIPFIGNYLSRNKENNKKENIFLLCSHVRYVVAMLIVPATFITINIFISWWIGSNMLLSRSIIILLSIDLYIFLVHGSTTDFINAGGMFQEERNIEIIGALTNIGASIILVFFYRIEGVLIGTVISQLFFWIARSVVVYKNCLNLKKGNYIYYIVRNIIYVAVCITVICLSLILVNKLTIENKLFEFISAGILCEVISIITLFVFFAKDKANEQMLSILKTEINRRIAVNDHS